MLDPNAKPVEPPQEAAPPESEKAPKKRSAQEQMEDFEQALKETDWGHQPC